MPNRTVADRQPAAPADPAADDRPARLAALAAAYEALRLQPGPDRDRARRALANALERHGRPFTSDDNIRYHHQGDGDVLRVVLVAAPKRYDWAGRRYDGARGSDGKGRVRRPGPAETQGL